MFAAGDVMRCSFMNLKWSRGVRKICVHLSPKATHSGPLSVNLRIAQRQDISNYEHRYFWTIFWSSARWSLEILCMVCPGRFAAGLLAQRARSQKNTGAPFVAHGRLRLELDAVLCTWHECCQILCEVSSRVQFCMTAPDSSFSSKCVVAPRIGAWMC